MTARVVLPEADADAETDEEAVDEEDADVNDGDLLANFPDETEVRFSFEFRQKSYAICYHKEIELLHLRIGSLSPLQLERFGSLKRLCLRQNSISFIDPTTFHRLTLLEELDLYDNKLKSLGDALDKCSNLK